MKILLAIDGSAYSDAVLADVSKRPWPSGSELRIVTVVPPLDPGILRSAASSVLDEVVSRRLTEASRFVQKAGEAARRNPAFTSVQPVLLEGRAKEVIVDEADRWGADLIVVGSHGSSALRRFFLGSVALAVATNAACSVEIIRCPSKPFEVEPPVAD